MTHRLICSTKHSAAGDRCLYCFVVIFYFMCLVSAAYIYYQEIISVLLISLNDINNNKN